MANVVVAYILWLFGGWFGLHHFYLGRDRHAFVCWATCGGCFGLGWLRDFFKISEYTTDANNDTGYLQSLTPLRIIHPRPTSSTARFIGELVMGYLLGLLLRLIIPEEYTVKGLGWFITVMLPPYGVAVGVHLVANIGRHTCKFSWPLIGAFIPLPLLFYKPENYMLCALLSTIVTNQWGIHWEDKERKKKQFCKRAVILTFCGFIYLSMWTSGIYLNCSITNEYGESIPLREAIPNFFKSPAWEDMKATMGRLYDFYKIHGWEKLWEQFVLSMDPTGEANAYRVLGLDADASKKDITKRYRELAKEFHPDKVKDPDKKKAAEEKFMEIQNAYEILTKLKSKRGEKKSWKSESTKQSRYKYKYKHKHTEF